MSRRVVVHIGTHRTGTTSIQQALTDARDSVLTRSGYAFPEPLILEKEHLELSFASMRADRMAEVSRYYDWILEQRGHRVRSCYDACWPELVRESVDALSEPDAVYSCEALCWLRHPDEIERLLEVLGGPEVTVALFVRDPAAFVESYQWMMQWLGHARSDAPDSVMYLEPDSWLLDREGLAAPWRQVVGADRVHVVDYDACLRERGSSIPALLDIMGVPADEAALVGDHRLNGRPSFGVTPG